ncbi:MAG: chemotaxis protein CheB [Sedimentisphaeraceae bacterium JB056]
MANKKIRVIIVDGSQERRLRYRSILEESDLMTVVSEFRKGKDAAAQTKALCADIIIMGPELSDMDGYQATAHILETLATPIVMVSDLSDTQIENKAIASGALAAIENINPQSLEYEKQKKNLIDTIICMSEVKVVTRRMNRFFKNIKNNNSNTENLAEIEKIASLTNQKKKQTVVAIGVSTGGPPLIGAILSEIKKEFSHPICLIQHISKDFTDSMVSWLSSQSILPVHKIKTGMKISGGNVYVAPGGSNTIVNTDESFSIVPISNPIKPTPSVDHFFMSLQKNYGKNVIAILMTGMGNDGAEGLKLLKDSGAQTIVQNKESCIVYGMPEAAIKMGAAMNEMTPQQIVKLLNSL